MLFKFMLMGMLWIGTTFACLAQSATHTGWLASFNTFSLKNKWSVHLDVQARSTDALSQVQTLLFRPGINFQVRKNQVITAGYAYIPNRIVTAEDNELLAEHRLWQQFIVNQPVAKTSIQHRFRFEERFLPQAALRNNDLYTEDYNFSSRLRYFTRGIIPLQKQASTFTEGMFTALQNEIFFNTSHLDHVNGETFDQNRLYVALGYRIVKSFDIEAGYMWQYVNRKEGLSDINNNIGQIAVYWRR